MNVNSSNKQLILSRLAQNQGHITTKEVCSLGIHRQFLKQLVDSGQLVQTGRGIYQSPDVMEDELFDIQTEYKSGVYSYETSLYLFSLLERVPFCWTMTFKGQYHSEKLKKRGIQIKLCVPEFFESGTVDALTPGNHKVKAYCAERTLCEILKPKAKTDIQVVTYAFKEYAKKSEKNLPLLMHYAKIFKVEDKVRSYIEVLV
jgi:predicted transcriptional regulator of viral defense system